MKRCINCDSETKSVVVPDSVGKGTHETDECPNCGEDVETTSTETATVRMTLDVKFTYDSEESCADYAADQLGITVEPKEDDIAVVKVSLLERQMRVDPWDMGSLPALINQGRYILDRYMNDKFNWRAHLEALYRQLHMARGTVVPRGGELGGPFCNEWFEKVGALLQVNDSEVTCPLCEAKYSSDETFSKFTHKGQEVCACLTCKKDLGLA